MLVYLRGHEGRGIGLAHKIRAYQLQEQGHDTVDANLELGLPVDSREYGIGAQMLVDLGVTTMRLMTNNPLKYGGLEGFGLDITERVPLQPSPNPENIEYLRTKRERMGHLLEGLDDVALTRWRSSDEAKSRGTPMDGRRVGTSLQGDHDGRGLRIGLACALFNGGITWRLLEGALAGSTRGRGRPGRPDAWPGCPGPSSCRWWPRASPRPAPSTRWSPWAP